jgi:hypothetical protein
MAHPEIAQETGSELLARLTALRRRLWLRDGVRCVARAAGGALGIVLLLALLAVLGLWPAPGGEATVALVAVVGAASLAVLLRPPSLLATARAVDREAQLADRLGTAVELLGRAPLSPASAAQLADATAHLRALRPAEAVPLGPLRRELGLVAAVALLAAGMVLLAGLGEALPPGLRPLREALRAAGTALAPPTEASPAAVQAPGAVDARLAPLFQQLEALRNAEAQLGPEEAAARRAAVAQQLAQMAAASRAQQEALAALARALQNTAAAEAAEALHRGDYALAAEALAALGRESDQLSPAARRELAESLRQATNALRGLNPSLAERAQRAAQALSGRDYRRTERALHDLAEAIVQAGQGVVPPADLGLLGEALSEQGEDLDAALASLAQLGAGANSGSNPSNGGQVGGAPGTAPGAASRGSDTRLTTPGHPQPLDSLPSLDGLPSAEPPDPQGRSVLAPVSIGTTSGGAAPQGGEALRAAAETGSVPAERREVVRGYFGGEVAR